MFKYVAAFEHSREKSFPWENRGLRAKPGQYPIEQSGGKALSDIHSDRGPYPKEKN